jgi:hypothetical protein
MSNTACPGCLYITSDTIGTLTDQGSIFTVPAHSPDGTMPTFLTHVTGAEPEGIEFITPNTCTLSGTDFSYFVSGYAHGGQITNGMATNGALIAYSTAKLAPYVGQALIPIEVGPNNTGSSILAFNPTKTGSGAFTVFDTPTAPGTTDLYQFEGSTVVPSSPSCVLCKGTPSTNSSNFNGTAIAAGDWIWFNSNLSAKGIPSTGATLTLNSSTITFSLGGKSYDLAVPNGQIVFSPTASCTSTTFNTVTNTWMTTVPIKGDDEIFLSGLSFRVPVGGLSGGANPVNWNGTFSTGGTTGVTVAWKWGAAVYSSFTTSYNALAVKPAHQSACGPSNGDHAGTPEGVNGSQSWKSFVLGGARGGGGSNWTGSWSGTLNVTPQCTVASVTGPEKIGPFAPKKTDSFSIALASTTPIYFAPRYSTPSTYTPATPLLSMLR